MLSPTFPSLASPGSGSGHHAGPFIPLADLDPNTNPAKGHDSLDKGGRAIPLAELRKAVQGIENGPDGLPSKIHDFVATDNGVVSTAQAAITDQWLNTKSGALKIIEKSEAIKGMFCPCVTYGRVEYELDKAQKERSHQASNEEDKFNDCNGPCVGYAALTIFLLSNKQTEAIRLFYNMTEHDRNKALEVVVHNAANLRNLVEVRIREEVRRRLPKPIDEVAEQYKSQLPMEMKKILPDQIPQLELPQAVEDVLKDGKPRAISVIDRYKKIFTGKASELSAEEPKMELPKTLSPVPNSMEAEPSTASQEGQPTEQIPRAETDQPTSSAPGIDVPLEWTKGPLTLIEAIKLKHDEQPKEPKEPKKPKKPKTKSGKRSKKSEKAKGKEVDTGTEPTKPTSAELDDGGDNAAQDPEQVAESMPEVRLVRGESIVEIPTNARVHSLSGDTFLITKPSQPPHSLNLDTIISLDKAQVSHALEHDQIVQFKPAPQEHRLSTDAMIPATAAAPGHFLEGDPVVSGPQQLFSHELLNDPVVKRAKAFLPHTLESDQKVAAAKPSKAHDLTSDTILPAPPPKTVAHALDSDAMIVVSPGAAGHGAHDISRDVRILSPSGQVRSTHTIDADEVIKEGLLFRKSPRPEGAAMPGNWASSTTSEEDAAGENKIDGNKNNKNLVASLDAVVSAADQALDELGRPTSSGKENRAADEPTSRGFWGKMFPKRHADGAADSTTPGDEPAV
ncbi:hypothetical protein Daus18300_004069 [Diaporthe australafricana]|uniref:Uncharacterized protein n=1 Tax=Diaporthe australafricana TaxID=127596 RepID=A0ABR3XBE3_9PEZI